MPGKEHDQTEVAFNILKQAMKDDPDYAYSWHCNIAMMAYDAGASHKVANEGASRFMKLAFGTDNYIPKNEKK